MADNVELNAGTGGATIAADDVGGVHYQVVKLDVGGDGASAPVSNSNPVPVSDAGGSITVDAASLPLPTGASTAAKQPALGTAGTASADVISVQGIASMTPVQVSDAGGSLTVDNGGTFAVQVSSIAAGNNNIGDVDIASIAAGNNNIGDVDVASIAAGDNNIGNVDIASIAAGDNNIGNVDVVTMPNVTLAAGTNTNEVVGDVAHDAAAAGNPVQTGGYATNSIEGVTQVAAGDLTRTVHDLNGVQVVRPHTTLEELISERVTNTDGASTAFTNFAAGGSGVHNYITQVSIWNSSATDGFVDFRDGTGGAVKWTFPAPQTGGCNMSFDPPLKFADNTAVAFDVSGAISTIYISANGFQAQG